MQIHRQQSTLAHSISPPRRPPASDDEQHVAPLTPSPKQPAAPGIPLHTRECTPVDADAIDYDSVYLDSEDNSSETSQSSSSDEELCTTRQATPCCKEETPLLPGEIYRTPTEITELAKNSYGNPSSIKLDRRDDAPELLISLYPHGVLQLLLVLHPATAINLIKCRLRLFTAQTGLDALYKALKRVKNDWHRRMTNRDNQLMLLTTLKAYERKHSLYPLEAKLDANYLIHKGRITSTALASAPVSLESDTLPDLQPKTTASWLRALSTTSKRRELLLRNAVRHLAKKKRDQALNQTLAVILQRPLVDCSGCTNDYRLLDQYLQEQPDTVLTLATELACENVKHRRSSQNISAAKTLLAMEQQTTQANHRALAELLDDNPSCLRDELAHELIKLHRICLDTQLTQHPPTSLSAMLEFRRHLYFAISTNWALHDLQSLKAHQANISAQLVQLLLFTQSMQNSQDNDIFPTWYVLSPPSSKHIHSVLIQANDSPEKDFYMAALKFLDAQSSMITNKGFQHDLHWLQCYYDVVYYQQQLLVHLIKQEADHPLLPSDQFEQNIQHLCQLVKVRKTIGGRALNPDSYAYALTALNFVWQEEEKIEDTVAELYRKHYLHLLAYDPCTEFKNLFFHTASWGSATTRLLCIKAGKLLQKFENSESTDVLDFLYQEGTGLLSSLFGTDSRIHTLISETLTSLLAVAQQSPAFFRVMWGDFALLLPQLQSLLGRDASLLAPLESMALCLRGQALASLFSGDTPRPMDFDPSKNPQYANITKRFQLLHDIISALHKGLPVLDIFLCNNLFDLEKRLQKVAWNSLSTYLARQCIATMKPPLIRLSNNLRCALDLMPSFNLGTTPEFLASISPEATVRIAHHFGRQGTLIGGTLSYLLDPIVVRLDQYKKRIDQAAADPGNTEARKQLAAERRKIGYIFGVASVLLAATFGFINTFRAVVLFGSPMLGAALISITLFLIIACHLARYYNPFDDVWTSLSEMVATHMDRTIPPGSAKAIAARQHAEQISKITLQKMAKTRQQTLTESQNNAFRLALSQYWDQLQYTDDTLPDIQTTLDQRWHSQIKEDVFHIQNFVNARELVVAALKDVDGLITSNERMADFNEQLAKLHFLPLEPAVLPYQLIDLNQEIDAYLEHSCGTTTPGATAKAIMATLETYQTALYKGDHLLSILNVRNIESTMQDFEDSEKQATTSESSGQLPDSQKAVQILEQARQGCYTRQLQKEQQVCETRMAMVTHRALGEWLKQQDRRNASSIPDLANDPLFKTNLQLQLQLLEKAGNLRSRSGPHDQHEINSTNVHGSSYRLMAAYSAQHRNVST